MGIANATGRERGRSVSVSVSTVHGARFTVDGHAEGYLPFLSSAAPSPGAGGEPPTPIDEARRVAGCMMYDARGLPPPSCVVSCRVWSCCVCTLSTYATLRYAAAAAYAGLDPSICKLGQTTIATLGCASQTRSLSFLFCA